MSYVDLKKEIENLLPIKDRLDERFTTLHEETRRFSNSYQSFPEIVVQPPEAELNTATSMPDIRTFLKKDSKREPLFSNISEINSSCPNLRDESYYSNQHTESDNLEMDDVFDDYDDLSENVSVCSEIYHHDSEPDSYKSNDYSDYSNSKPKARKMTRRKRKEEQPLEMLRKNLKIKHSTSLHNLPGRRRQDIDPTYNSYYTVHGKYDLTHHSPSAYSNYQHFDYSPGSQQKVNACRTNFGSVDRIKNYPHNSPSLHHPDHPFYTRSISSPHSNLIQSHNNFDTIRETEIVYKCCCGGANCKKVVPIFDYLETYFDRTVRFFSSNSRLEQQM